MHNSARRCRLAEFVFWAKHFENPSTFRQKHFEVKSSGYRAHVSLDEFGKKFSSAIQQRYLVYTKDLHKDGDALLVPAYMTPLLAE